jgi:hypothetical protein
MVEAAVPDLRMLKGRLRAKSAPSRMFFSGSANRPDDATSTPLAASP